MGDMLKFDPPEGSPIAAYTKQVDGLRRRNKMLRVALKNLLDMEEFRRIQGKESELHSGIILQAKSILELI